MGRLLPGERARATPEDAGDDEEELSRSHQETHVEVSGHPVLRDGRSHQDCHSRSDGHCKEPLCFVIP